MTRRAVVLTISVFLLIAANVNAQNGSEKWLAVEITDESGMPLKNACVSFVPKVGHIVFRKGDKRGRVRLTNPMSGDYRVVVKVDGYKAQKKEVTIGATSETVAFALRTNVQR